MELKKPQYIIIHHTGVPAEKNPDQFRANNNYHQSKWNFKSSLGFYLGYNYEISKAGRAYKAREDGEATAAVYQEGMNDGRAIHIALDGNFNIENPSPNQIYKLRDMLREKVKAYKIPTENILFHRDLSKTQCPGDNMDKVFIHSLVSDTAIEEASKPVSGHSTKAIVTRIQGHVDEIQKALALLQDR